MSKVKIRPHFFFPHILNTRELPGLKHSQSLFSLQPSALS
jgi:hypothetical protein